MREVVQYYLLRVEAEAAALNSHVSNYLFEVTREVCEVANDLVDSNEAVLERGCDRIPDDLG